MTYTDKNIVEAYSTLFEGLSAISKIELIENLTKSLKNEKIKNDDKFFKSFGAFASSKSPKNIYAEIKASRKFKKKEFNL
jgi:hypothetical protein